MDHGCRESRGFADIPSADIDSVHAMEIEKTNSVESILCYF